MDLSQIVIDTNVWVAGFRSRHGASWRLLSLVGARAVRPYISVALVLEYEDIFMRQHREMNLSRREAEALVDDICELGMEQKIFYRWRGFSPDPGDDHVLELAVASETDVLVTYNKRDFLEADSFGIEVLNAHEFLERIC